MLYKSTKMQKQRGDDAPQAADFPRLGGHGLGGGGGGGGGGGRCTHVLGGQCLNADVRASVHLRACGGFTYASPRGQ